MPGVVAANWKMNASAGHVREFVSELAGLWQSTDVQALIFPPCGYLPALVAALAEHGLAAEVGLGAQNMHPEANGAFTGEMSGAMLQELGASWVIVGHSERRSLFAEDDEFVARKAVAALQIGLRPIVCVGESLEQRDSGQAEATVLRQVQHLKGYIEQNIGEAGCAEITMAYEPIWAIGTGRTATPAQAQQMHALIREQMLGSTPILYGGSVKPENAASLFAEPDINGGLVGGAALEAHSFWRIIEAASAQSV